MSQDSQGREDPVLARQTGVISHLPSAPLLLCPASCTRLHRFSFCLIQIALHKMLQKGAWSSHGWCLLSTPHALHPSSWSLSLPYAPLWLSSLWGSSGWNSPSPHHPIPKPLALKGSFSKFTMLPQIWSLPSANSRHSVDLHDLISHIK